MSSENQRLPTVEPEGKELRPAFTSYLTVAIAILLVVNIVYSLSAFVNVRTTLSKASDFQGLGLTGVVKLHGHANDAVQEAFAYVVSGEQIEKVEFLHWGESFDRQVQEFRELKTSQQKDDLVAIEPIIGIQKRLVQRALVMFSEYENSGKISSATFHEFEDAVDEMGSQFAVLQELEKTQYENAKSNAEKTLQIAGFRLPVFGGLSTFLSLLLFSLLIWSFRRYSRDQAGIRNTLENRERLVSMELEKVKKELVVDTRLKAIGQMSAQVAHELRNPLGAVSNAVYFLRKQVPDGEAKWIEYLNLISGEVSTCNRFIEDMLGVTRAKKPMVENTLVSELIEASMGHHVFPNQIKVNVQCIPEGIEICVDQVQFVQVLDNLFRNSLDAIGENPGQIDIRAQRTGKNDIISFEDSGQGVPPQHRTSIFDVMFTTKLTGTGLGLPICKQIIEQHRGSIRLLNGQFLTTRFEIRLPLSDSRTGPV